MEEELSAVFVRSENREQFVCLSTPPIPSWQQRGCRRPRLRKQKGQNLLTWCTKLVLQGGLLSRAFRESECSLVRWLLIDSYWWCWLGMDFWARRKEMAEFSNYFSRAGPIRGGVPENRKRKRKSSFQFAFPETGSYSYSSESMRTKYAYSTRVWQCIPCIHV